MPLGTAEHLASWDRSITPTAPSRASFRPSRQVDCLPASEEVYGSRTVAAASPLSAVAARAERSAKPSVSAALSSAQLRRLARNEPRQPGRGTVAPSAHLLDDCGGPDHRRNASSPARQAVVCRPSNGPWA